MKNAQQFIQCFLISVALFIPLASIAASTNVVATANLIPAIVITKNSDLAFGNLFPATIAGTVKMDTANNRTQTGGILLLTSNTGNAATFSLAGSNNGVYVITLPSTVILAGPGVLP